MNSQQTVDGTAVKTLTEVSDAPAGPPRPALRPLRGTPRSGWCSRFSLFQA